MCLTFDKAKQEETGEVIPMDAESEVQHPSYSRFDRDAPVELTTGFDGSRRQVVWDPAEERFCVTASASRESPQPAAILAGSFSSS